MHSYRLLAFLLSVLEDSPRHSAVCMHCVHDNPAHAACKTMMCATSWMHSPKLMLLRGVTPRDDPRSSAVAVVFH